MHAKNPLNNQTTEVEIVDDSHEPWLLVRCPKTDFTFIANPPSYDRLSEEFAWEKTLESTRAEKQKKERLMGRVSTLAKQVKFLINPKRNRIFNVAKSVVQADQLNEIRILDVGCGNGKLMVDFCHRFAKSNIQVVPVGIEVSHQLAEESNERFAQNGGEVIENNAIDGMKSVEPGTIDMVIMHSFLEHEAQPIELLDAIHSAIQPQGSVVLKVPNFDCWNRKLRGKRWPGYRYPDHVSYFTPSTLEMLANNANFDVARQNWSDRLPMSDNMYAVLKKQAPVNSIQKAA